jgi:hypothetical protein
LGEVLTTLPVKTYVKKYSQGEMLPLETKQSLERIIHINRKKQQHFEISGGAAAQNLGIAGLGDNYQSLGRAPHSLSGHTGLLLLLYL